jgi:kinetochore protein Mis13/DSN1
MKAPPPLSPLFDPSVPCDPNTIDTSLLDPEDAALLASLAPSSSSSLAAKTEARLKAIQDGLEFKVDQFADGIHKLGQARQMMEKVANKVMALSSLRLDEREIKEKEAVGTRDMPIMEVLRALSRVVPENNQAGHSGSRS